MNVLSMKKKISFLWLIILFFIVFFLLNINNQKSEIIEDHEKSSSNNVIYFDNVKVSQISSKVHIIGNQGWLDFKNDGNCTGTGIYSDPYVIKDLEIDAAGSGVCILIESSDVYFRIENCTLDNAETGIKLQSVANGTIINNTISQMIGTTGGNGGIGETG